MNRSPEEDRANHDRRETKLPRKGSIRGSASFRLARPDTFVSETGQNLRNQVIPTGCQAALRVAVDSAVRSAVQGGGVRHADVQHATVQPLALPGVFPQALPGVLPKAMPEVSPKAMLGGSPKALPDVCPQALPGVLPKALPGVLPKALPGVLPQALPGVLPQALPGV
ncbi:MAG: hypothetical protein EA381_00255, partial [Planctomycetaceae bacterium]